MTQALTPTVGVALLAMQAGVVWRLRQADWRLMAWLLPLQLAVTAACSWALKACPEGLVSSTTALWASVGGAAFAGGLAAARQTRRVPTRELFLCLLPNADLFGLGLLSGTLVADDNVAGALFRAVLVLPALYGLCAYFGASLGYVWLSGKTLGFGFESLIGRRFLLSKASPVLSTVTAISIIGVSLGVWLVLVSLGVLAGFEADLQRKIIGANAHLVVQKSDLKPFDYSPAFAKQVADASATPQAGVLAHATFLQAEVAIASDSQYTGAMLFGVDPKRSSRVIAVLRQVTHGTLAPLQAEQSAQNAAPSTQPDDHNATFFKPAAMLGMVIGKEMARSLNVKVGDRIRLISPTLEVLSPLGPAPKSLAFRIAGIFSSDMYEYDSRYVYVSLPAARRFLDLAPDQISGLQVQCVQSEQTGGARRAIMAAAQAAHVADLTTLDWRQRNQTLFSALQLERIVAFVVLVFIILVASFSIVNTLTMSVIEKRREIAILKTMGARDGSILQIFLTQGLLVGGFGTVMGCTLGVISMKLLERFGFWIPGEVYYIDSLPVALHLSDVALVSAAALLIVWDFSVFPSLRGSECTPVEGLRDA